MPHSGSANPWVVNPSAGLLLLSIHSTQRQHRSNAIMAIAAAARSLITSAVHAPLMMVLTDASLSANQMMSLTDKEFWQSDTAAGKQQLSAAKILGSRGSYFENVHVACSRHHRRGTDNAVLQSTAHSGMGNSVGNLNEAPVNFMDGVRRGPHSCTIELHDVQIHSAFSANRSRFWPASNLT